ncbi:HD-GYP domain-containing protein [Thermoanaerobacteraceae bacterium SP2]|jgi:HD-GYP domain-containing protein (c-di-GMP phosphodiesterase class II)|nr:HD-GYP domain-containing protein [Thermoanaerobacteraceae bacterium SP2]
MEKSKDDFFSEMVAALSLMMDFSENRKLYHAWRVAILSEKLSQKILPEYRTEIFYAGLLHDIGAISLPYHVVHYEKNDKPCENSILFNHPKKSATIVKKLGLLFLASDIILDHHERWDGSGYPRGIAGNDITLGGQILRISDTVDILLRENFTSSGNIKKKLSLRRGKEFSDKIYEAMEATLDEDDFFDDITSEKSIFQIVLKTMKNLPSANMAPCESEMDETIKVFAEVIDAKHNYTAGHSERVAIYTYILAKALGIPEKQARKLKVAGYLHDAGKVAIPRAILDKPGRLTLDEFKLIKRHPVYTMEIMSMINCLKDLVIIAGSHHERYDGMGYPGRMLRNYIPLGGRIMAVADAYDAMTSERPYQHKRNPIEAKDILIKYSGSQFDPEIVKVAVKVLP